jgi:hypothetical protein
MFIAMNRFRVAKGSEGAFEQVWMSRDSHLEKVPGFVHLLKGPEAEGSRASTKGDHGAAKLSEGSPQTRSDWSGSKCSAGGVPAIPENRLCDARHGR